MGLFLCGKKMCICKTFDTFCQFYSFKRFVAICSFTNISWHYSQHWYCHTKMVFVNLLVYNMYIIYDIWIHIMYNYLTLAISLDHFANQHLVGTVSASIMWGNRNNYSQESFQRTWRFWCQSGHQRPGLGLTQISGKILQESPIFLELHFLIYKIIASYQIILNFLLCQHSGGTPGKY